MLCRNHSLTSNWKSTLPLLSYHSALAASLIMFPFYYEEVRVLLFSQEIMNDISCTGIVLETLRRGACIEQTLRKHY